MKHPSAYLKMRVLGAIDVTEGRTQQERIKHVAKLEFIDEDGNPRQFTWSTIQTWLQRYTKHGITGMHASPRIDKGQPRKFSPEDLMEAINSALPHFRDRKFNKMEIYRFCIKQGLISPKEIAQTTFYRFVREYDLLKNTEHDSKRRLAFAMQYANELWQADTMFGPYVADSKGIKRQVKLIAFIDDASRVICHGEFFFQENTFSLVAALKSALYKRGIPHQLYVDNGSIYSCAEITLVCARIGCILRHTPVRDGAAKGKIERFFRRVRDQFLIRNLDLSSLERLNRQFTDWVEDEYNCSDHSGIGMKPIDRFGLDLKRIRFLPPNEANDELFFAETTRKVKKDNTFSLNNVRYETPVDLRGKQVQVRYDRTKRNRIITFYKDQRMGEAKELDLIANGKLRQRKES